MTKEIVIDKIPEEFMYKSLGGSCSGECFQTKDGRVFKKYKIYIFNKRNNGGLENESNGTFS